MKLLGIVSQTAAMLSIALLLYLAGRACAYTLVCSDQSNSSVTFEPSDDLGRYKVEICTTHIQPDISKWSVDLLYNDRATTCNRTHHSRHPGKLHSQLTLYSPEQKVKNCTFVCMSTYFEMIFSSCYVIKSTIYQDGNDFPPYDTYHNITNKFSIRNFESDPSVTVLYHEKDLSIYFYTVAPSTDYVIDLCSLNTTNTGTVCLKVTNNCTTSLRDTEVRCSLAPPVGCYKIWLTHIAPWTTGVFNNRSIVSHNFCVRPMPQKGVSGSDWTVAWVCGALVLATGAALLLWRMRDAIALHKRVLRYWTELSQESRASIAMQEAQAQAESTPCRHILLVYAREGPVGQRVADALRVLLQRSTSATVHDVFSPETLAAAAAAGAPADWVRSLLARADCRLLLLQTPALACLHPAPAPAPAPDTGCAAVTVSEPLLGGRAVYRVPQFGDSLAQFALRLLAHSSAHQHHRDPDRDQQDLPAYKKYYLATLSELQTEVFPQVVPFRRYALPDAAPLLVTQMAAAVPPPAPQALQQLQHAVHEFALHVRNNPDYLLDELVFT